MCKQLIQRAVEEQGQSRNLSISGNRTSTDRGDQSLLQSEGKTDGPETGKWFIFNGRTTYRKLMEEKWFLQNRKPHPLYHVCSKLLQSCLTFCDPMDHSLPDSSVHEILQARILEWVAISFSRGSSRPRDRTQVSCIAGGFFTNWATREALYMVYPSLNTTQCFVYSSVTQK